MKKCREELNVFMNYEFNLLQHVSVVAERPRAAAAETASHEGDDNTPSGPTGCCSSDENVLSDHTVLINKSNERICIKLLPEVSGQEKIYYLEYTTEKSFRRYVNMYYYCTIIRQL